ncbi:MAG: ABC transporter substrate-binding protein [Paracoccaceae bacterium]|nr:ABC transporter substrate-binding protein [Paracoccaceae bacterium]
MKRILLAALLASSSTLAYAEGEPLKIGFMATLEGPFTVLGEDGQRGFELALREADYEVAGRPIEVIVGPTDASPESALRAARKLVEQDEVDIVIGPLSGSEGIAMRDYSKTVPQVTFINGISGAQETTLVDPSETFYRYNMDGAQWTIGLGDYVFNEKGWEVVATIAEDYSFGYTNFMGFALEFCRAGGDIVERQWVPLGTKDFSSIIAALPEDVDALYLGLGGADAVNFLNQYLQAGGDANLIGGTIMVDGTVLSSEGRAKEVLIGTPSSGPQADTWDDPNWQGFVTAYQEAWPPEQRFPSPSLLATGYYNSTNAMLAAMEAVDGDLSDGQAGFRAALASLELDAPNGMISLDGNRQAIGSNFVTEVVQMDDGTLATQLVNKIDGVEQTLGLTSEQFAELGLPSRDVVDCTAWQGR